MYILSGKNEHPNSPFSLAVATLNKTRHSPESRIHFGRKAYFSNEKKSPSRLWYTNWNQTERLSDISFAIVCCISIVQYENHGYELKSKYFEGVNQP